jgi:structural maintenance of chromosome 1
MARWRALMLARVFHVLLVHRSISRRRRTVASPSLVYVVVLVFVFPFYKYIHSIMPVTILEIENFKSYGGKHIIGPFSNHLTSIIGPNGCGKSNLMDAISFVFGLHASSLRSHQLKDLIYRGSSSEGGGHATASKNDDEEDTNQPKRAGKRKKDSKNTSAGKLKCSVTLVYKEDEHDDDESKGSTTEIRFTRTISPNGSCEYFVNQQSHSRSEYEDALNGIGVLVNVRNCFVFQGDVENLARKNPVEMISLFEQMSGSIEYKQEFDALYHQKEELEQQQKLIVQQKKVHEYERQQYKTQKLEADKFHDLVQQRNTTLSDFYLWQLYHLDQDRVEKEESAAAIQEHLQDATQNESNIQQQVHDHKKEITKLRRVTNQAEKHRMKQATIYDQYEPSRIQISEEIANLQKKLELDQKLLQKKIQEESQHEERLQKIENQILEYQQTDQDLTKEYEEEKSKLLSTVAGGSSPAAPLTTQQEDEYEVLRELANEASMEPRRLLQQQQRKYETSQSALVQISTEYDEVQKSMHQVQHDVAQLTERSNVMSKVSILFS